jgi:predicted proteasome-type protease
LHSIQKNGKAERASLLSKKIMEEEELYGMYGKYNTYKDLTEEEIEWMITEYNDGKILINRRINEGLPHEEYQGIAKVKMKD